MTVPPVEPSGDEHSIREIERLIQVTHTLRHECPWDRQQTQKSLVQYLIEETAEAVEAIEKDCVHDMVEELGDLLFEVIFQAEIGKEDGRFTLADLASGVADKLISRHEWVFGGEEVPTDVLGTWEKNKVAEKHRASALDDIPEPLSSIARAHKTVTRIRRNDIACNLDDEPITSTEVGEQILALIARAEASHVDPDQALRTAVRELDSHARAVEAAQ